MRSAAGSFLRAAFHALEAIGHPLRLGPPSAEAISRMEATIDWIFLLDTEEERRIIWLRAARVPWRPICYQLGCKRTTAHHKHKMALSKIVTRLNAKRNGGRNG